MSVSAKKLKAGDRILDDDRTGTVRYNVPDSGGRKIVVDYDDGRTSQIWASSSDRFMLEGE